MARKKTAKGVRIRCNANVRPLEQSGVIYAPKQEVVVSEETVERYKDCHLSDKTPWIEVLEEGVAMPEIAALGPTNQAAMTSGPPPRTEGPPAAGDG